VSHSCTSTAPIEQGQAKRTGFPLFSVSAGFAPAILARLVIRHLLKSPNINAAAPMLSENIKTPNLTNIGCEIRIKFEIRKSRVTVSAFGLDVFAQFRVSGAQ
jgi:hypothetical protein